MGVYGNFISNFPELYETMYISENGEDYQSLRAIYIPQSGLSLIRNKGGIDLNGLDVLYVPIKYCNKIKVGMYFKRNKKSAVQKVVNDVEYWKSGDYHVFLIEKVSGHNPEMKGIVDIRTPIYS